MATSSPPFDPIPHLTAAYAGAFRGLLRRVFNDVVDEAIKAGDLAALLGSGALLVPTGRALVAKSSPLKVEDPASPAVMCFESAPIKALYGFALTAPVGADITVQVKKWKGGSASNVCQPSDLLTIPDGANFGMLAGSRLLDYWVARGDWLYLSVASVGSGTKGDLLTCLVEYDAAVHASQRGG